MKINFEKCDKQFLESKLGLIRDNEMPELNNWVLSKSDVRDYERDLLNRLRVNVRYKLEEWNEESIKINVIAPILGLIDFNNEKYGAFADEPLEAKVNEYVLTGKVDWLVAKGKYRPETPYFFLHEYKRARHFQPDPDGQLVASMLAAQTLNTNAIELLYGIVVTGQFWYFVLLKNQTYGISRYHDILKEEDLLQIFQILRTTKELIDKQITKS